MGGKRDLKTGKFTGYTSQLDRYIWRNPPARPPGPPLAALEGYQAARGYVMAPETPMAPVRGQKLSLEHILQDLEDSQFRMAWGLRKIED